MQLVVKLYNDKPPRIGVIYPSEYQASKSYESLLEKKEQGPFHVYIEIGKGVLSLKLKSAEGDVVTWYKDLEFKPDQIRQLQMNVASTARMNFTHIYKKENTMFVPKIRFKNPELLQISYYEIISPDGN